MEAIVIENNYKDEKIKEFLSGFNFILLYKLDFYNVYINKKYLSGGIKLRLKIWKLNVLLERIKNKLKSFTQ